MYQPAAFADTDRDRALDVMRTHPFAIIVSNDAEAPFATHAPLAADWRGDALILTGHMARANPHAALLGLEPNVLAIFSGPDGYVSPSNYGTREAVPTWNYVAIHAYGALTLRDTHEQKDAVLKRLIADHDPDYAPQWRGLSPDYQAKMLDGICTFEVTVERLEVKFKLSQNRGAEDRVRVAAKHAQGTHKEQALAAWMKRLGLV